MGRKSPGEIGRDQAIRTVAEIIGRIRIAMLTTLTGDGAFRSRPITTHGARFDGDLWFLTRMGSAKIEEVRQHLPEKVFQTIIPRTVRLSEAPSFGQPIFAYDPSSPGAVAYSALGKELANRFGLMYGGTTEGKT